MRQPNIHQIRRGALRHGLALLAAAVALAVSAVPAGAAPPPRPDASPPVAGDQPPTPPVSELAPPAEFEDLVGAGPDPADPSSEPVKKPRPDKCTIEGTAGNDVLRGTSGRDVLCGNGGNDRLIGGGGNDLLIGGPGRDRIEGGSGRDVIRAKDGTRDGVLGGSGRDAGHVDPRDRVSSVERRGAAKFSSVYGDHLLNLGPGGYRIGATFCTRGYINYGATTEVEGPVVRGLDRTTGEDASLMWFRNYYFVWNGTRWALETSSAWHWGYASDVRGVLNWRNASTGGTVPGWDSPKSNWNSGYYIAVAQKVVWADTANRFEAERFHWTRHDQGGNQNVGFCSF